MSTPYNNWLLNIQPTYFTLRWVKQPRSLPNPTPNDYILTPIIFHPSPDSDPYLAFFLDLHHPHTVPSLITEGLKHVHSHFTLPRPERICVEPCHKHPDDPGLLHIPTPARWITACLRRSRGTPYHPLLENLLLHPKEVPTTCYPIKPLTGVYRLITLL
jgi:hypothetical protein